ncbi:MAG TPA: S-layer homology domain-containing protein, partial [Acidimicrobiia bacterium]|nr:S-layer homology domain-containing protein [Acidimicrobiia bacterium]
MASFLSRALGLGSVGSGPFTDIGGTPHAGAINAIAAAGITLGCAGDRYCPEQPVRRDEMASFLTRAFSLTPAASPFRDTAGNVHEEAIGALASAGITLGCAPGAYCPSASVRRDEMASFLTRALGLDAVLVQMTLADSPTLECTKDGLVCRGAFTIPHRAAYAVSEGFYHVLPFTAGELQAFQSSSTRFELMVNGSAQPLVDASTESAGTAYRLFEGEVTLPPGRHQLVARWYWQGSPTRTTILDLEVRA